MSEESAVNNFDVLKRMSEQNKDIRMGPDLIDAQWSKRGSRLTFGVPGNVLMDIESGKLRAVVLLWDVNQFDETKRAMQSYCVRCLVEPQVPASVFCQRCHEQSAGIGAEVR